MLSADTAPCTLHRLITCAQANSLSLITCIKSRNSLKAFPICSDFNDNWTNRHPTSCVNTRNWHNALSHKRVINTVNVRLHHAYSCCYSHCTSNELQNRQMSVVIVPSIVEQTLSTAMASVSVVCHNLLLQVKKCKTHAYRVSSHVPWISLSRLQLYARP